MRVEGHRRIYSPLAVFAYTLVGIAILLTGQFSRRGQLERILVSIGIVVFLLSTDLGLATLAAKNLALVPLLYLWAFVPIIAAITLIQISLSRLAPPRLIQIMTGGA
jgi:lipopolysaccharide export system permease protein